MFDLLDSALRNLLDAAPPNGGDRWFSDADITFDTPEKGFVPKQGDIAINLFLYEVKENRELRQAAPGRDTVGARSQMRRAALRVDCSYMVTTWSNIDDEDNVANAHRLLGQAFRWLSRFPVIPEALLPATLEPQLFAPPTLVAQMEGAKGVGEFWSALGIAPRPYFNLVVTVSMDLAQSVEDATVSTVSASALPIGADAAPGALLVGGTVRDTAGDPIADAWVRLEPPTAQGRSQIRVTDAAGHFIFEQVPRGTGYALRARARGHAERHVANVEVPSLSGNYEIVV